MSSIQPCLLNIRQAFGQEVLDTIIEVQPKDSAGGGGESRETAVNRMCDDMLQRMPQDFNPFKVCATTNDAAKLRQGLCDDMLLRMPFLGLARVQSVLASRFNQCFFSFVWFIWLFCFCFVFLVLVCFVCFSSS